MPPFGLLQLRFRNRRGPRAVLSRWMEKAKLCETGHKPSAPGPESISMVGESPKCGQLSLAANHEDHQAHCMTAWRRKGIFAVNRVAFASRADHAKFRTPWPSQYGHSKHRIERGLDGGTSRD